MRIIKKIQEYKLNILGILFERKPVISGEVHARLLKEMNGSHPSRASVINFMNSLVAFSHVEYEEETGKGGHHRVYSLKGTPDDFMNRLELQRNHQFSEEYSLPLGART